MSEQRKFFKASSNYLISQVAVLAISLISFPIVVRLLSVEDYGVLSLCNTILLFGVALSKLGMQNSIIRFYPDYEKQGELSCFLRSFVALGVVLGFIFFWISGLVSYAFIPDSLSGVIWFVAGVCLFQSFSSYLTSFLRSQEKTALYSLIVFLGRFFGSFGGITLILLFHNGILNLFQAQFVSQMLIVIFLLFFLRQYFRGEGDFLSIPLLLESIKFGAPLLAFEVSSISLAFSDRFLITYFNGLEQLGIYSVAYSLCMYIGDFIRQPLSLAVGPMYTRIYAQKGADEAGVFLAELGRLVALIAAPVFFGCVALRSDLIVFLASEKYLESAPIIPWVLGGFLFYACQPLISAGLFLKKKTSIVAKISLICVLINIVSNYILLPKFGIIAAGWSTAGSYLLAVLLITYFSSLSLPIKWPLLPIFKYILAAFLMFIIVLNLPTNFNLFLKILIGFLTYPTLVLIIDGYIRKQVKNFLCGLKI